MAIIVEGFDNSGKSTLSQEFGLDIVHPGPAPKNRMQELVCLEEQEHNARLPIVMDRVTCISSQIYGNRLFDSELMDRLKTLVSTPHCILIYCRPDLDRILDFSQHVKKGYDKSSDIKWLEKHALRLVAQYDQLMASVPHMKYDWVNPDPSVVSEAFDAQFTIGAWRSCQNKLNSLSLV